MSNNETAPLGTPQKIEISGIHAINQENIKRDPNPKESMIVFGLGCFWGAERKFWNTQGVNVTAVGYAGGETQHPSYKSVCSGKTQHAEVVKVIFDTDEISLQALLQVFWDNHDPTQGMKQGHDIGSQYRSVIYTTSKTQLEAVEASVESYQKQLSAAGFGPITTERQPLDIFYYAEEYHQQYLYKNPQGYCGLAGTGIICLPV